MFRLLFYSPNIFEDRTPLLCDLSCRPPGVAMESTERNHEMTNTYFAALLFMAAALLGAAPAHADPAPGCDARWQACESPRWCGTTGSWLPPLSGYCPMGPTNYPPPRLTERADD